MTSFVSNLVRLCISTSFVVFILSTSFAQDDDLPFDLNPAPELIMAKHSTPLNVLVIPGVLMGTSGFLNKTRLFNIDHSIKLERDEDCSGFRTRIDDYLQFAPILAAYTMGFTHDKSQVWLYTKRLWMTEAMIGILVPKLKSWSKVKNPDSESYNAFPSGHTAEAFAVATLFCDHFAKNRPLVIGLAYTSATAVGCLRVLNNQHWATDVIAGAGFGIFSAKISEIIFKDKKRSDIK